ncbi:MBL fold metallo-hydrolase [Leifsonia sp. NPDC080035]|uniref:MBL fold metallo-hydrolase n=1 Tax=Leifsonia sp. NPDC080035 TaxID=3143936 RepID=A0AAU7GGF6_9MICO
MELTILGAASHYPKPGAPCSGALLEHDGTAVLVDAGPGTLAELQRYRSPADLDAIWISHVHADHTADLLPLYYALRFGDLPERPPVPVLGPPDLRKRLVAFLGGGAEDGIDAAFAFTSLADRDARRIGAIDLTWRAVDHDVPAWALRAEAGAASIVVTGDAAPCTALQELAAGCDLLLAEAGAEREDAHPAHLTPEQAGALADTADASRLVLTHLALTLDPADAARRAATRYDGPVEVAVSGARVSVGLPTVEA